MKKKRKPKADVAIRIYKQDRKKLKRLAVNKNKTLAGMVELLLLTYY